MGMDYQYAGSASYPRFDDEIKKVVELLGGVESKELQNRKETENERPFGYWFGYMSSSDDNMEKYIFPEGTNKIVVKWFNHIYDDFSPEDTKIIYKELHPYKDSIQGVCRQLWCELRNLYAYGEGWGIE